MLAVPVTCMPTIASFQTAVLANYLASYLIEHTSDRLKLAIAYIAIDSLAVTFRE